MWFSDTFQNNLRKILHKFLRKFSRFLKSTRRSSWDILMKFRENCETILKKFKKNWEENVKWFQKNYGVIIVKNWRNPKLMLSILWRNFKKIFEIISVKLKKKPANKSQKNFEKIQETLRTNILIKILWNFQSNFWNQLLEVFEVFWWNFEKIARKFCRNLREIDKKIFDSRKIMETLLGKTKLIRNWCLTILRNFRKFFWSNFSEIEKDTKKSYRHFEKI